jgi:hypothetical protein
LKTTRILKKYSGIACHIQPNCYDIAIIGLIVVPGEVLDHGFLLPPEEEFSIHSQCNYYGSENSMGDKKTVLIGMRMGVLHTAMSHRSKKHVLKVTFCFYSTNSFQDFVNY